MHLLVALGLVLALAVPASAKPYLKKPRHGFQMRVGEFTVQPGEDLEVCEYRRTPNRKAVDVTGFELRMPPGAHHFVVWAYGGERQDDAAFPADVVESVGCTGVSPDELVPQVLIPLQNPNTKFSFPPGIALRLEPGQQVWLNPHMKNLGPETITPDVRFNVTYAKKGSVEHHAEGLIAGNMGDIDVPPGGDQTLTAEWTVPFDLTLISYATHQHRLGTYANIEQVAADGSTTLLYETTDWQHARPKWPKPFLHLAAGDRMRITCQWHNTDAKAVRFGPETTDEMCFILAFYYRDTPDEPLSGSQCIPSRNGLLCPFAPAIVK
ncbi:MAG TPA: hypothetical protein VGR62_23880 [Candidatus Binatia bacterium]|jgi:hypothetical protein|nr:hypothetical protein [Candidatus Binatia bacterium]